MSTCSVPDCNSKVLCRGMCNKHYQRILKYGSLSTKIRTAPNNCGKFYCPAVRSVKTALLMASREEKCSVDDCNRPLRAKGFCFIHYKRLWRTGDPQAERFVRRDPGEPNNCGKRLCPALNRIKGFLGYQKNPADYIRRVRERKARVDYGFSILSDSDRELIKALYKEAKELTLTTGVQHEVDHIVPLKARKATGLHVPWNLRVVTKDFNIRRKRIWCWSRQDC